MALAAPETGVGPYAPTGWTNPGLRIRRMARASWYTYRDDETGRVVTNAYERELEQIQKISGVPCEVVPGGVLVPGGTVKIGPKLSPPAAR